MESLRILRLLLHKNWLVRKRHWIRSLVGEILLPASMFLCARLLFDNVVEGLGDTNYRSDSYYTMQPCKTLFRKYPSFRRHIIYTPNNEFIDQLMTMVQNCSGFESQLFRGFHTIDDMMDFANNSTSLYSPDIQVIFDHSTSCSTKHLQYMINAGKIKLPLYKLLHLDNMTRFYKDYGIDIHIQTCVYESFFKMKANATNQILPQVFIKRVPYPKHSPALFPRRPDHELYEIFVMVIFMIPLFIEMIVDVDEKFSGINVLLSMNGISNLLNFFSWIISGLLPLVTFCAISTQLMFLRLDKDSYSLTGYGDPLVLFFFFVVHVLHVMAFGIHVSAYFNKSILVTFALTITCMVALSLRLNSFHDINLSINFIFFTGIVFPNFTIYRAVNVISMYRRTATSFHWANLFAHPHPTSRLSIGMLLTSSTIGIIFHFSLALYVYAIYPGRYGIGKHPFFFVMTSKRSKKEFLDAAFNHEYVEHVSPEVHTIGMEIRNLRKVYNFGYFNKGKIYALRGISVNFYKGHITTLLGHNGAGKSTLMSILTGMISATDGDVIINSKNLKENAFEVLKDVGLCAQDNMYFSSLTVREHLEFFAMVKRNNKSRTEIKKNVSKLIEKLKLCNVKDYLPSVLSQDQRRKLCLGMAFVGDPNILILDEPTMRLDYESKRLIWDLLQEMKSDKTIVISTHDMKEADLLGDRVAILHEGRLKCYGSPLFLKQMIGGQDNVEITLSIANWSHPESIRNVLHPEANIISEQVKQIVVRIPISPTLSRALENLEKKKKDFGVSSYSLSLVSLETVYLKLTQDDGNPSNSLDLKINETKLKGLALFNQSVRALLLKKLTYILKESVTLAVNIFTTMIALIAVTIILLNDDFTVDVNQAHTIPIQLNIYKNPYTLVASFNKTISDRYKTICQTQGGRSIEITGTSLDYELMRRARENLFDFNKYLIAAAEFNHTTESLVAIAFYSDTISFSLPISVNLTYNTIIKTLLGDDYSISVVEPSVSLLEYQSNQIYYRAKGFQAAIALVIPLCLIGAVFAIHPSRELSIGLKHLQKMTGISGFTYWAIMFLSDFMQYTFLVVVLVFGFMCVDFFYNLRLYEPNDLMRLMLLLMLYATNALPLSYIFSFFRTRMSAGVKLLTCILIGAAAIEFAMLKFYSLRDFPLVRPVQKSIFLLLPSVSFLHAGIEFYAISLMNARCRRLSNEFYDRCRTNYDYCCNLNCYDGKCLESESRETLLSRRIFRTIDFDFERSLLYLCLTPMLYFSILAVIEGRFIQKVNAQFTKHRAREPDPDEQVEREKLSILENIHMLNERRKNRTKLVPIQTEDSSNNIFLAYGLRKSFGKLKAVEDVSFRVNHQECFGIYGTNRAGKSVTFRMITGEEVPDHGIMLMNNERLGNNKNCLLLQMGYCPQQEAIMKSLNAYDHLQLFARLRGIPESQVASEVDIWINKLNLRFCADLPSSAYSSGNKQRLSIAMALIGSPNMVVFDEPTTRVDPGARRSFWNIIKSCQLTGQTFVFASYSMDECEALCGRMAIMVEGRLTCIGSPEELKQRFGAGYDVQIRFDPRVLSTQLDQLKSSMRLLLPCTLTNEYSGSLMYYISGPGTTWRRLYDILNKLKNKYEFIDDYVVVVRLTT